MTSRINYGPLRTETLAQQVVAILRAEPFNMSQVEQDGRYISLPDDASNDLSDAVQQFVEATNGVSHYAKE